MEQDLARIEPVSGCPVAGTKSGGRSVKRVSSCYRWSLRGCIIAEKRLRRRRLMIYKTLLAERVEGGLQSDQFRTPDGAMRRFSSICYRGVVRMIERAVEHR